MHVSRRLRAVLYALGALTGLGVLAYAAHIAFSPGPDSLDDFFQDWVYCCAASRSAGSAARGF